MEPAWLTPSQQSHFRFSEKITFLLELLDFKMVYNSKEHHIFSELKHGFCNKMKNKKICTKEWSKKHVLHSHFFIFHPKPIRGFHVT